MPAPLSRRRLLAGLAVASAGCAGATDAGNGGGGGTSPDGTDSSPASRSPDHSDTTTGPPPTLTGECTAADPPAPSTGAAEPKPYPSKPDELSADTARAFAEAYERAYQYNGQLAEYPDKLGRTNDLDISIYETTVESTANGYRVVLSGQRNWSIRDRDLTPETPTRTPLPIGHRPFETTYLVTGRFVRRNGVVLECW